MKALIEAIRVDMKPHQRAYCYLNDMKIGYAIPVRDSWFRRPWCWLSFDMNHNFLGTTTSRSEAMSVCFITGSRRVMSLAGRLVNR